MNATTLSRYVKEFEETQFWKNVMRPAMEASIQEAMVTMVYMDSLKDLRTLQAGIKMTQAWIEFPARKLREAEEEAEFEKSQGTDEEEGEDYTQQATK